MILCFVFCVICILVALVLMILAACRKDDKYFVDMCFIGAIFVTLAAFIVGGAAVYYSIKYEQHRRF
jgi:asparagine N-glycosylation enzyme membrane subunit Stt3